MKEVVKNRIALTVNGKTFEGFEGGTVTVCMDDPCNSFSLDYVADGKSPSTRGIYPGDDCELAIDAGSGLETLIKGYVDSTDDDDSKDAIKLSCAGRSKAADLVDCSAAPGSWKSTGLAAIAKAIADPFGVKVVVDGDSGGPFETFRVVNGETPLETIQRAAAQRGLYCFSVGDTLVVAKAGTKSSGATLQRGVNIVRSSRSDSWFSRHSEYVFRGQVRGSDGLGPKGAATNKASVKDETITRYRPLLLHAGAKATELKRRAEVERNQRAGRGEVVTVTVDGWGTPAGKVWRANTTVEVKNSVLGIDATLLIASATYRFGADVNRETELRLCRPQAFDVATFPKAKRGAKIT